MIQDLHSHTYYSMCGKDKPEIIVEAAIKGGIELFGICDHSYGIGQSKFNVFVSECDDLFEDYERTLVRYFDHINLIKEKYADKIKVLCGIEVASDIGRKRAPLPQSADISFFDYCLVENLDNIENSSLKGDIFAFNERSGCLTGIAHTDMFAFIEKIGEEPYAYFKRLAENNIFWEMNVSFDSIHNYREHPYVLEFFKNGEQQQIIRESGVKLSIGFDGHKVEDYLPDRVKDYCNKIGELGIPMVFE